jgi:hypothetical protein
MEEDSDEEWNELMKFDMDDVFMEEVAICQAAMKQNLMLMMLMDEEDSHHQRDRKNEFRHKPRNTKRKFRHDQLNLLTCL